MAAHAFGSRRLLKKAEIQAPSFDRLRMRASDFNGLDLMVSSSRFGGLTVRPWATSFFRSLLESRARAAISTIV